MASWPWAGERLVRPADAVDREYGALAWSVWEVACCRFIEGISEPILGWLSEMETRKSGIISSTVDDIHNSGQIPHRLRKTQRRLLASSEYMPGELRISAWGEASASSAVIPSGRREPEPITSTGLGTKCRSRPKSEPLSRRTCAESAVTQGALAGDDRGSAHEPLALAGFRTSMRTLTLLPAARIAMPDNPPWFDNGPCCESSARDASA